MGQERGVAAATKPTTAPKLSGQNDQSSDMLAAAPTGPTSPMVKTKQDLNSAEPQPVSAVDQKQDVGAKRSSAEVNDAEPQPVSAVVKKQEVGATRSSAPLKGGARQVAKSTKSTVASPKVSRPKKGIKTDVTKPHPQGAITDYEFQQGMANLRDVMSGKKQATHPNGTPLELLFENKRFKCWFAEVDGLLCMLTEAHFNIKVSNIYKTLTDFDYQLTYDDYIKHKSVIDHVDGNEVVFHEVKLPSPLTNRDYVYYRKRVPDEEAGVYKWFQRDLPDWGRAQRAEVKGVIRAGRGDFWQHALLEKTGEDSCKMMMIQQDNPAGDIPKWAMNFATKKGIPSFFKGVEEAAQQLSVRAGDMTEKEFKAWKKAYSSTV
jgi:hypothetical protein